MSFKTLLLGPDFIAPSEKIPSPKHINSSDTSSAVGSKRKRQEANPPPIYCLKPGCYKDKRKLERYIFPSNSKLIRHENTKHCLEKPFKCPIVGCNYSTKRKDSLAMHIKKGTHTMLGPRPRVKPPNRKYVCEYEGCRFACGAKAKINEHNYIHTGEKPHKCDYCEYACRRQDSLRKHLLEKHGQSTSKVAALNIAMEEGESDGSAGDNAEEEMEDVGEEEEVDIVKGGKMFDLPRIP